MLSMKGKTLTHVREINPKEDNNKGLVPITEHTSAIVMAVED